MYKIHITCMKSGDSYIGFVTNTPGIITQTKSMSEMKENMKSYIKSWIKKFPYNNETSMFSECIKQEEPFEIREKEMDKMVKAMKIYHGKD